MKNLLAFSALCLASFALPPAAEAQTAQDQQVIAAIKEVQAQQAQIAENQAKIEAKMAAIAEAVRVTKIYASRAGH